MRQLNFKSRNNPETALALALVALGIFFRLMPHPDNVTPTAAIALFAGVALSGAPAYIVPVLIMAATDIFIGHHSLFWVVWPTFLLVTWVGQSVREKNGVLPIACATLAGSVLFFVITNLGVFFFERMYPMTWAGLVECFTMALPFFRNSLIGDFVYSAVLFSLFELARRGIRVAERS